MKGEHADLLELSTLKRALRSVVEEIPRDKLGQRGAMETSLKIWVASESMMGNRFLCIR